MLTRIFIIVAVVMLTGCGANFTSIYRDYNVDPSKRTTTVVIDAKQRAIISTPRKSDETDRTAFVCAEPSPDALSAISASLAGGFGLARPGKEERIALSTAVQEAAKQLGTRNATIQLLRDGLYRQCEAYMNGLINDKTYDQIANKYINAMVVLLAVEQLTTQAISTAQDGTEGQDASTVTSEVSLSLPKVRLGKETDQTSSETVKSPTDEAEATDSPPQEGTESDATPEKTSAEPSDQAAAGPSEPNVPAKQDETAVESEKPVPPVQSEQGDPTPSGTTPNTAGEASATAAAGSPAVSVQPPMIAGSGVSDSISTAVRDMTHAFLRKDTVDFCLYTLPRLATGSSTDGGADVSRTLVEGFVGVCRLIVATEYTGGAVLPDEIFEFLRQEADRLKLQREAVEGMSTDLPPLIQPLPPITEEPLSTTTTGEPPPSATHDIDQE